MSLVPLSLSRTPASSTWPPEPVHASPGCARNLSGLCSRDPNGVSIAAHSPCIALPWAVRQSRWSIYPELRELRLTLWHRLSPSSMSAVMSQVFSQCVLSSLLLQPGNPGVPKRNNHSPVIRPSKGLSIVRIERWLSG